MSVIDHAIKLFEDGQVEDAAHVLVSVRQSAVEAHDDERLAELVDVVGQMRAKLSGDRLDSFNGVLLSSGRNTQTSKRKRRASWLAFAIGVPVGAIVIFVLIVFLFWEIRIPGD